MDQVILCPLEIELKYLLEGFKKLNLEIKPAQIGKLNAYEIPQINALVCRGGHGKVQFGVQTQYVISQFPNLNSIFCVGAAGALSEELNVGDLVIAEKTIEHDYTEKFNTKAQLPEFLGNADLLGKAKSVKGANFKIHFGCIASGDEDIISHERAVELQKKTGALAVAWEGAGGARACSFNKMPFLELRGITDNARHDVANSFEKNLPVVMNNLSYFLESVLK